MTKFQKWLFRWLMRNILAGDFQYAKMVEMNRVMAEELQARFPEDNLPTTACLMRDAVKDSFMYSNKWPVRFYDGIFNNTHQGH